MIKSWSHNYKYLLLAFLLGLGLIPLGYWREMVSGLYVYAETMGDLMLGGAAIYTAWWARKTFGYEEKKVKYETLLKLLSEARFKTGLYYMAEYFDQMETINYLRETHSDDFEKKFSDFMTANDDVRSEITTRIYDADIATKVLGLVNDYQYNFDKKIKEMIEQDATDLIVQSVNNDYIQVMADIRERGRI